MFGVQMDICFCFIRPEGLLFLLKTNIMIIIEVAWNLYFVSTFKIIIMYYILLNR